MIANEVSARYFGRPIRYEWNLLKRRQRRMKTIAPHRVRRGIVLSVWIALVVPSSMGLPSPGQRTVSAQQRVRLNPMIARLAQGQPALMGEVWQYVDMEHSPFSIEKLERMLAEIVKKRPDGQFEKAPVVRIPLEGDEPFRWAIKQVLDIGVMGVIIPHVESGAQALEAVRAMRYPPQRGAKYPEPEGKRGFGPGRAIRLWGISTDQYFERADLWPLNPDGELTLTLMIETAEGVKNINEIAQVPGVSIINVGSGDLANSLGVRSAERGPTGVAPETEAALQTVLKACKAHKVVCSMGGRTNQEQRLKEGWRVLFAEGAQVM